MPSALLRFPRLCLLLLCLALYLPGLAAIPPTDRDESRFAQATHQMLQSGDYVRILNGTVPRNRKPIGIYWLQSATVTAAHVLTGVGEGTIWPYRLASTLGAVVAVMATFDLGLTLLGSADAALLAAALLASCVILVTEAHLAKTDAALAGVTTVAMAVFARAWIGEILTARRAALFWAAMGAGILIKGPVTPMVAGLSVLALGLSTRSWRWLGRLRPASGGAITVLMVLPWFVAIGLATHGAFFHDAIGGDLGRKLAGGEETHGGLPGTHLLLAPLLAFPGTEAVLLGAVSAWASRRERAARFLLCWLVPSWLIFEAVPTKLPHYTLPLYPALALLAARWLATAAIQPLPWLLQAARLLPLLVSILLAGAAIALPMAMHAPPWAGMAAGLLVLGAGAAAWRRRLALAITTAAAFYAVLLQWELPGMAPLWLSARAAALLPASAAPAFRIAACYAEPSLMFALGRTLVFMPTGESAAILLGTKPSGAVLVADVCREGFLAEAARRGMALHAAGSVAGFNYSRGRRVTLSLWVRDQGRAQDDRGRF